MVGQVDQNADKPQQIEILWQIAGMLDGIRFGSVEIVVHDSMVVQNERKNSGLTVPANKLSQVQRITADLPN